MKVANEDAATASDRNPLFIANQRRGLRSGYDAGELSPYAALLLGAGLYERMFERRAISTKRSYTVSLLVDSGLFQFDFTDNHFGVNGGLGILRSVTENWSLDLNVQIHKFWTADDVDDIFYVYSDGDRNPLFYQITAGATLRLF